MSTHLGLMKGWKMINYDFDNKFPLWHRHPGQILKTNQRIINGEIIQTYPDNDGGLWYRDKKGKKVVVNE